MALISTVSSRHGPHSQQSARSPHGQSTALPCTVSSRHGPTVSSRHAVRHGPWSIATKHSQQLARTSHPTWLLRRLSAWTSILKSDNDVISLIGVLAHYSLGHIGLSLCHKGWLTTFWAALRFIRQKSSSLDIFSWIKMEVYNSSFRGGELHKL